MSQNKNVQNKCPKIKMCKIKSAKIKMSNGRGGAGMIFANNR